MKEKRTLILGEAFFPEDFIINDLVQQWEKEGRVIEVLTRAPSYPLGKVYKGYKNKIYQTTFFGGVKIHRFPVLQGYQNSTIIKVLNYFTFVFWSCWIVLFIGKRFDRVFIYQTGPLTLATAGIFLKKLYGAQVTIWTQDLWPETVYAYGFKKTKLLCCCLDGFVKWIYKNCDVILVSCKGFIPKIKRFVPHAQIEFVPNWSLMKYCPTGRVRLPGIFNFTFAGNIGKMQNLDLILAGFDIFVKKNPSAYLNIIGDGSFLDELKQQVREREILNVNFTGRKKLEEMSDFYQASDVLIISLKDVPLYKMMIPSKFQAYLTTAKPIFAIFKGEVKNMVEEYGLGFTADPSDVVSIANGFEQFLSLSEKELEEISDHALSLLHSIYDREKVIEKIDRIFWKIER